MTHRALTVIAWLAGITAFLGVITAVTGGTCHIFATGVGVLAVAVTALDWIDWRRKA